MVKDVCREYGILDVTYYQWESKFGGMEPSDIKRLRELEDENRKLKLMVADLSLENRAIKEAFGLKRLASTRNEMQLNNCSHTA